MVEEEVTPDPADLALLGRPGVMPQTKDFAHLIEEFSGQLLRRLPLGFVLVGSGWYIIHHSESKLIHLRRRPNREGVFL